MRRSQAPSVLRLARSPLDIGTPVLRGNSSSRSVLETPSQPANNLVSKFISPLEPSASTNTSGRTKSGGEEKKLRISSEAEEKRKELLIQAQPDPAKHADPPTTLSSLLQQDENQSKQSNHELEKYRHPNESDDESYEEEVVQEEQEEEVVHEMHEIQEEQAVQEEAQAVQEEIKDGKEPISSSVEKPITEVAPLLHEKEEENATQQILFSIILCLPSLQQVAYFGEVLEMAVNDRERGSNLLTRFINYPPLASAAMEEHSFNPSVSGKMLVLDTILQYTEESQNVIIVCEEDETRQAMERQYGEAANVQLTSTQNLMNHAETFLRGMGSNTRETRIVLFDPVDRGFHGSLCEMVRRETTKQSKVSIHRLITSHSYEEYAFLDYLEDIDFEREMFTAKKKEKLVIHESHHHACVLADRLKDLTQKYQRFPDEAFHLLWPHLLSLSWHAETGGGLADYNYCRPGFSSKKSKTKTKGQKHVDYFCSKEKVVKHFKTNTTFDQHVSLTCGIHNLIAWNKDQGLTDPFLQQLQEKKDQVGIAMMLSISSDDN